MCSRFGINVTRCMKKIYTVKSRIDGYGIFTDEYIRKGEFVLYIKGKKIHHKYVDKVDKERCANWVGIGKDLWIDPDFPISRINHSCEPNLGLMGAVTLKALRDIERGEELTLDYSITDSEEDWSIPCSCGSGKCREVIRSIQFLPHKIFKRYMPYVPTYFQKVYVSSMKNR